MHEVAIAEKLVDVILAELEQAGSPPPTLKRARIVVGALQQIVPENLKQAYAAITSDTRAAGSELDITTVPVKAVCGECRCETVIEGGFFVCPTCGSRDMTVTEGRELVLTSLEVDDDDQSHKSIP